jgi:hypothetical protein
MPRRQTLEAGLLDLFPGAKREELEGWKDRIQKEADLEPNLLFFVALLCGTHYRVTRAEPKLVLEEVRAWLTSIPKSLPPQVADVVIESLAPGIERVLRARGWRSGPEDRPATVKGRPPEAPGAWAAGVLADAEFRRVGFSDPKAVKEAIAFASLLLGRAVASSEFYAARQASRSHPVDLLLDAIRYRYQLLQFDIGHLWLNPAPSREDQSAYQAWRERYRDLRYELAFLGCEQTAREVLGAIPGELWLPGPGLAGSSAGPRKRAAKRSAPKRLRPKGKPQ